MCKEAKRSHDATRAPRGQGLCQPVPVRAPQIRGSRGGEGARVTRGAGVKAGGGGAQHQCCGARPGRCGNLGQWFKSQARPGLGCLLFKERQDQICCDVRACFPGRGLCLCRALLSFGHKESARIAKGQTG